MYVTLVKRKENIIIRAYYDDNNDYFDPIYSWFKILHSRYTLDKESIIRQLKDLTKGSPTDVNLLISFFSSGYHEVETDPSMISQPGKSPFLNATCLQMIKRHGEKYLINLNHSLNTIRGVNVNIFEGNLMQVEFQKACDKYKEKIKTLSDEIHQIVESAKFDLNTDVDFYIQKFQSSIEDLFKDLRDIDKLADESNKLEISHRMIVNDDVTGLVISLPTISDKLGWDGIILSDTSPELFIETYCNFGKAPEVEPENPISKIKELEIPPMPRGIPENHPEETQPINIAEPFVVVAAFEYKGTMINIQSLDPAKLAEVTKYLLG